jgi:hypothetical protein
MSTLYDSVRAALLAGLGAAALAGCNLDVTNPTVINAGDLDPVEDARRFSLSAQTNFYVANSLISLFGGYLSNELWVGAVRTPTNDIGRRALTPANADIDGAMWAPLSVAVATNDQVLQLLAGTADEASNIDLARSAMNSGFSLTLMGETFCQGVIQGGPALTPAQVRDTAIVRFTRAIEVGTAAGNDEGLEIATASQVGLARASLQNGDAAGAIAAAAAVPPDFEHDAFYSADLANLGLLGNQIVFFDNTVVVPEPYVALNDPRVPNEDTGDASQDPALEFVLQLKYQSFDSPIRVASGLEARYITAEAELSQGQSATALALIAERRNAGGQPAFAGTTAAEILAELMDQRARDFWLEAKHLGDIQRNPGSTPFVPVPGTPFYKPTYGDFGSDNCAPLPLSETLNNPNF